MDLALYIAPMTVSFQGIDVAEIPCNEYRPPEGYYATTNFDGVLSHSLAAGAGVWHHVSAGNYWCNDNAKSNRRKQVWSNGRMVWDVPIQWYERFEGGTSWPLGLAFSGAKLIGGSPETYQQVFEISEEGLVSITKHSHCIDRNTNDVIRLDGVMVHDGSHF